MFLTSYQYDIALWLAALGHRGEDTADFCFHHHQLGRHLAADMLRTTHLVEMLSQLK